MHYVADVKARPRDRCRCSNAPVFGTEAPWLSGCLLSSEVLVRFQPVPPAICPCWITVSPAVSRAARAGAIPARDASAVISGETTIGSANPAPVRSFGANERRVRFPPLRPHHRSKDGTQGCEACWLRFESSRWYPAGRWCSVTGLLIRGGPKGHRNPSSAPCPHRSSAASRRASAPSRSPRSCHSLQSVLVHRRGPYPRTREFDSLDCDCSSPSGSRDSLRRVAGRSRCVIQTTTAARSFVRLYIARAGARPRVQIESGGVRLLGDVLRPRVARAAVWQQSRWVMPSLSARQLSAGCSSDWQSARFGTERPMVQVHLPRRQT